MIQTDKVYQLYYNKYFSNLKNIIIFYREYMNDNYYQKYLKDKYSSLKSKIENQNGGMESPIPYFKKSAVVSDTKKQGSFRKTVEFGIFKEKRLIKTEN